MKKKIVLVLLLLVGAFVLVSLVGCGSDSSSTNTSAKATTTPGGHQTLSNEQLTDIAPGLGTIMMEISNRNWIGYYAATQGNWELADYQIKELNEIREVGEVTRPKRAEALKSFESKALPPLQDAIKAKDMAKFQAAWTSEVEACNACHVSQGFKYIKWTLPSTPPENLALGAQ